MSRNKSTSWRVVRQEVLVRDNAKCAYCDGAANTVDHVVPVAAGGADDPSNLVACCSTCNGEARDLVFNSLSEKRTYLRWSRFGIGVNPLTAIGVSIEDEMRASAGLPPRGR